MGKSILAMVFSLLCLALVTAGPLEAKGGKSGGGGRSARSVPAHGPRPVHHHHKQPKGGGGGGDVDAPSVDAQEAAEEAEETEESEQADEAEAAVYGVEITALYKGTAAKEGLNVGDIILSVNGTPTPTFAALAQAVARSGSKAVVVVLRDDGDDDGDDEPETVTLYPQDGRIGVSGERVRVDD